MSSRRWRSCEMIAAHRQRALAALLLLLLAIVGCERRPLEVILDEQVRVQVVVHWETNFVPIYGTTPNGMTVMIWGSESTSPMVRTTNSNSVTLRLPPDTYRMVVFNELAEEYTPYVSFYQADSYETMVQRATTYAATDWDQGNTYMYTPEDPRVAVALDTFVISRDMVQQDTNIFVPYEVYRDNPDIARQPSDRVYTIPETPWPMTVDLFVRLKLKHRQSLKTIEGNISGMADGFHVSKIIRTTETGTLRFDPDSWDRLRYGDDNDSLGLVVTRLASYGLPYGKELTSERDSADNIMKLHLTLTNDSVVDLTFKVGKDIRYITPEGVEKRIRYRQDLQHLELEVNLPDIINLPVIKPVGGAGFDAWVDEWEYGGTFDIGGF